VSWKPFAAIGGLVTGAATALSVLFDPTFLLSNPDLVFSLGFTVAKGGQEVAPNLPWEQIIIVLVTGSVLLTMAKIHDKRTSNP
jgi:hypothetical protein